MAILIKKNNSSLSFIAGSFLSNCRVGYRVVYANNAKKVKRAILFLKNLSNGQSSSSLRSI